MQLTDFVMKTAAYKELVQGLMPSSQQLVTGISGSARTLLIKSLLTDKSLSRSIVFVTDSMFHADQIVDDLSNILDDNQLFEFPVEEILAAEIATSSPDYMAQRIKALSALRNEQPVVVVTSVSGIRRQLPSPIDFDSTRVQLSIGMDIELDELASNLQRMGYNRKNLVDAPGDFAVRGSILDIYPIDLSYPIRVDFFDTEIDSLRYFDASTQRSVENVNAVIILPVTDILLDVEERIAAVNRLKTTLNNQKKLLDQTDFEKLESTIKSLLEDLQQGSVDPKLLMFQDYLFTHNSVLDYLGENGLLLVDDYSRLREANKRLEEDEAIWATDKLTALNVFPGQSFGLDFLRVLKKDIHSKVFFALFQKGMGNMRFSQNISFVTRTMQHFFGQMPLLKQEIHRWKTTHQIIVMMVANSDRLNKVGQTLTEFDIPSTLTKDGNIKFDGVQLIYGQLQSGFELPEAHIVVVTESEMFKKVTQHHKRRQTLANAERLKSYTDLKTGDYVVHLNHGIGRFEGMQTMEVDGVHQDYMTISYQKNDKLFIPVTQINLIQKYSSSEDKAPHVNRLGGTDWEKTKKKVADKIEDIADDLIDIYAAREAENGFAFPKDDDYQLEFNNAFPYTETPDQLRSVEEIKRDMERSRPMDRLLVGDVGYGKTEVALRSAFKAVEAGKQVAFLVPTTILAQQHYDTMVTRFDGYPINIAIMSRFQKTVDIKQTIEGLKDGSVDIVVGTHRLLSKDIVFKDMGFLIIDEEQRFGVKHKERLKQLKSQVDVLTLTATPIPRTLHMSILGVRDISVIETPPANRFPIQTYVMEQNSDAIQDGIHREMDRGGQVFYVHNRINDIEKTVDQLKTLVPDADIGYIHGQMTEGQLEGVLYDFVHGTYDVLVTTTIIETGIDISQVNTMFIENADQMGLSQLYQLRGRIGRSNRIAYAYFMYNPNKVLTEVSEKRLDAIKGFTELGSGFRIAMRDLSIRGAGNLLGKQQHGFIDSVGYDLYTQMLTDVVAKKQGRKSKINTNATVELGLKAYLPNNYISDQQQKIELYKRIRQIISHNDIVEIQNDLIDRFGDYPQEVNHLLNVSQIKVRADKALINKIHRNQDRIILYFSNQGTNLFNVADISRVLSQSQFKGSVNVEQDQLVIRLIIQNKLIVEDWLAELTLFVNDLSEILDEHLVE